MMKNKFIKNLYMSVLTQDTKVKFFELNMSMPRVQLEEEREVYIIIV